MIRLFFKFVDRLGRRYKGQIAGLFLLSIFAGVLEIAGVALIFPLIALVNDPELVETNRYLFAIYEFLGFDSPNAMIFTIAITIGAVFIFKNLFMIWFQNLQLGLIRIWGNEICARTMDRYLKAPYAYHLKHSASKLVNTLNFTVRFALNGFVFSCISMLSNIVVALMLLIFLLVQFPLASLVSGCVLIVLMIVQARFLRTQTAAIGAQINTARADNLAVMTQGIGAIKETKAYRREGHFLKTYDQSNQLISAHDKKMMFLQLIPAYISEMALVVTIIIMACFVLAQAYSPMGGMMSLAVLAAVAFRIAPMINRSLFSYSQIRVSAATTNELLDDIEELDRLETEPFTGAPAALPFTSHLRFDQLGFSYDGQVPALKNIDLTINKGEFIGIVGPSGAGKTTLVDIALGLLRPETGHYLVDDTPIDSAERLQALRAMTGYVSQNPYIVNGTVRENVAFGVPTDEIDDLRVVQALKMAHIDDFFKSRDDYINTRIGDQGKSLSGGQRQRLAIARALYVNPKIIVLDEATSALDVETEYEITKVINGLKGERTIIAIAHRLSTLKECDRLVLMDEGEIVGIGTFADLQQSHPSFSRLLSLSSITIPEGKRA